MSEANRPKVAATVLLLHKGPYGTEVLLGKRRGAVGAGQWAAPGGHVEHGETALAAALRELEEETGLTGIRLMPTVYGQKEANGQHYVSLYHYAWVKDKTQCVPQEREPDKIGEWAWLRWGDPSLDLFGTLRELMGLYPNPEFGILPRLQVPTHL